MACRPRSGKGCSVSRAGFNRRQQLRAKGLLPPLDPAVSAEMRRRRRLGIQRAASRQADWQRPELIEIDERALACLGPAFRRLLNQDVRKARAVVALATDPNPYRRGAIREALLKAGYPDKPNSLAVQGWRLFGRTGSIAWEALAEAGGPPPIPVLVPLAVRVLLAILADPSARASIRLDAAEFVLSCAAETRLVNDPVPDDPAGLRTRIRALAEELIATCHLTMHGAELADAVRRRLPEWLDDGGGTAPA